MVNKNYSIPQSNEAEQAILATIITDNEKWNMISEKIETTDFYKTEHQKIFDTMKFLLSKNEPIDIITLSNNLKIYKNFEKIGGNHYIKNLIKNAPYSQNIKTYIKIVKDKSILRKIIFTCQNIIEKTLNNKNKNIDEIINNAEEKILSISQKIKKNKITDISNILSNTIKNIEILYESNSPIIGISSGLKKIDYITSGFHKSDLIVIAGRPSMGKSTLAINIAENIIINSKIPVLIFSMEMSAEQIIIRILSSLSKINLQKLRSGMIEKTDWPKLTKSVAILSTKKLFIDDSGAITPLDIKNKARKIYQKNKDLGIIIIDYIQLIKIPEIKDNRSREIAEISRELKILAKELNIPIIILSQLNRSLELRNDKRPIMSDLRESGAIEQDADLIIFIYRDEVYNKNNNSGKAEIIIAKQRNGPIGKIDLNFLPEYCKFEDIK